jgi:hypothetical protein
MNNPLRRLARRRESTDARTIGAAALLDLDRGLDAG